MCCNMKNRHTWKECKECKVGVTVSSYRLNWYEHNWWKTCGFCCRTCLPRSQSMDRVNCSCQLTLSVIFNLVTLSPVMDAMFISLLRSNNSVKVVYLGRWVIALWSVAISSVYLWRCSAFKNLHQFTLICFAVNSCFTFSWGWFYPKLFHSFCLFCMSQK